MLFSELRSKIGPKLTLKDSNLTAKWQKGKLNGDAVLRLASGESIFAQFKDNKYDGIAISCNLHFLNEHEIIFEAMYQKNY